MSIHVRYVDFGGCTNTCFLPERPNGFVLLLLHDHDQAEDDFATYWVRSPQRKAFVDKLLEEGYTVLTSSLYEKHWGGERAVNHASQLVHLLLKKETLNDRIHILAEGTGALVARQLFASPQLHVRSAVFVNPQLSFVHAYEQKQKNELSKKRFKEEVANAFGVEPTNVDEKWLHQLEAKQKLAQGDYPPVRILQSLVERERQVATQSLSTSFLPKTQYVELHFVSKNQPLANVTRHVLPFLARFQ
ncbi:hypothetical protein [Shouchella shacheensis]|uniref:hypothetical protein n=1 Tax=Shouchella shacheensis TaxID=1649580 RepID=UPI0007400781|nr:hypothetical protein [Shouchella shacheensis]